MALRTVIAMLLSFPVCLAGLAREARADYVTLRSGGEIRGELLADAKSKTRNENQTVSIRTLSGATVAVVQSEVESIVRRRMIVEEYETRRRSAADSIAEQWDLAEWCREKMLSKERETHLRRVVELDSDHAPAHRALGHIRDSKGRWSTRDEIMAARGYVKYKGKYLLPQELELITQEERVTEAERGWFKRVRMWRSWLDSERLDRRNEGLAQLRAVHEPDAVAALAKSFKTSPNEEQRFLYVEIIAKISGDKPLQPLVLQSLWDESRRVREAAVGGVGHKDVNKALPFYIRALRNGLNLVVNRAGDALAELGNETVIPQLIDALVTRHQYIILVPDVPGGVRSDGSSMAAGQAMLPPNIELLLASGQLPYGVRVQEYPPTPVRMKEMTVEKDEENQSVLNALNLLTGQNFGFNEPAWRKWYTAHRGGAAKKRKTKP